MIFNIARLMAAMAVAVALSISAQAVAADAAAEGKENAVVDADAAEGLARKEGCLKCHGVEKSKDGPSFKKVAAKYKGKAEAEEKLQKHVRSGAWVKLDNGEEEEHRVIKSTDEKAVTNLIRWILSR